MTTKLESTLKTVWSRDSLERFWQKVDKTKSYLDCWEWQASTESGYGRIGINGKLILAHRLSWHIHNGKIPDKTCVLHKCDNRLCVNPTHLFLGTRLDNNKDRQAKGRSSGGRNGGGHAGETNGRAKLTLAQVQKIRSLLNIGSSGASIGRQYGVTKETIYAIKHGRNWCSA